MEDICYRLFLDDSLVVFFILDNYIFIAYNMTLEIFTITSHIVHTHFYLHIV